MKVRRFQQSFQILTALILAIGAPAHAQWTSNLVAPRPMETVCSDGIDNDGDGFVDGTGVNFDPDCGVEQLCQDGIDNDGDGSADGLDTDCMSLDDIVTSFADGSGCTANDVQFVLIGLGTQYDGCLNSSDLVDIQLGAGLQGTGGNTRYDIGMWVALDGQSFAAGNIRTGLGSRQMLDPRAGAPNLMPLNITGGQGAFRNDDPDKCGDLRGLQADPDARYNYPFRVRIPCQPATNGFLTVGTCASWDNNSNTTCNSLQGAVPGTSSKCNCGNSQSTIPRPNISFGLNSCTCTNDTNGITHCAVEYTNPGSGTCNPASSGAETFDLTGQATSCGTAAYLRFKTTYPSSTGTITARTTCLPTSPLVGGAPDANCLDATGRGTSSDDGAGTITWTPSSDPALASGVVGPNETERLRFEFTNDGTQTTGSLSFNTTAYWAQTSSFTGEVMQTSLACSVSVAATPVTLASFHAQREGDEIVVDWTTTTETGNAGFNLIAKSSTGTRKINPSLVASHVVDSLEAQSYRLRLPAAGLEEAELYLDDVSVQGEARRHGPFALGSEHGKAAESDPIDWAGIRAEQARTASFRDLRDHRTARQPAGAGATLAERAAPGPVALVDFKVDRDGIYRVTFEELTAAGFQLAGLRTSELALLNRGVAKPLRVAGDRRLGPGSYLEFVGEALDTLYTDVNVYSLVLDRKSALAVALEATTALPSAPLATYYMDSVRTERELEYSSASPTDDPWFEGYLMAFATPLEAQRTLSVDHLAVGTADARLDLGLWGGTAWAATPDHHVVVRLNGVDIADRTFDGRIDASISAAIPSALLHEGNNTLSIVMPSDLGLSWEFVGLDSYSVTYPRAFVAREDQLTFTAAGSRFAVSGLSSPDVVVYRRGGAGELTLLTGVRITAGAAGYTAELPGTEAPATYYLSTRGKVGKPGMAVARDGSSVLAGAASYLIISHAAFVPGLGPLVTDRRSQGFTVRVVDVDDVYAQFSHGIFDPQAIRDFIRYAVANLGTRYVLLVGGDTYDYRNYAGTGSMSFIPSLYRPTGTYVGFAPVDPLYADVDGDEVQEIAIGRLPVRTLAELDSVVARTREYEANTYPRTAILAADSFDESSATSFTALSESQASALPESWSIQRAYLDREGVSAARTKLLDAINRGVALTTFAGHSGPTVWTFQGLFSANDAAALANPGRPTVVSQMGCWNTYYVSPASSSMAHRLLLSGDRGAALVMGATTLTEVKSDIAFAEILAPLLAQSGKPLGEIVLEAKRTLAATHPEMRDVLLGWTLLGDPALKLQQ